MPCREDDSEVINSCEVYPQCLELSGNVVLGESRTDKEAKLGNFDTHLADVPKEELGENNGKWNRKRLELRI